MGGGGYDPGNLATAWCEVIGALLENDDRTDKAAAARSETAMQTR